MGYHYMPVGKLRVRYFDSADDGSGSSNKNSSNNNKSNAALLLIHGLGGSIESWSNNIGSLSEKLRVVALDLPGFGQSDKPGMEYTVRFYRDFVTEFVRALGTDRERRLSVAGSSLGGQVAAELALSSPGMVSKLVLISPAGALPRSFRGTPALRRYVKVTEARSAGEVKDALYAVDNKPVDDAYAEAVYQKMSMPGAREAFLSALKWSARAPRLTGRLSRIKAPTLLLWGKEDIMIPVNLAGPFVKMKNCRIIMLENCGHRPHAERPALFNRLVSDFILESD